MAQKLTKEDKGLIRKLHNQGLSTKEISSQLGIANSTAWIYAKSDPEETSPTTNYHDSWAQSKGYADFSDYKESHAIANGFQSYSEYQAHLENLRTQKAKNQELGELIQSELKRRKKNQTWLADCVDVTHQAVSSYINAKSYPSDEVVEKIYECFMHVESE
ncbi:hypothetical protein GOV14_05780 [Candidatus Pacearchaeota archaeon]|nr:hypothetical protein [Candidatus Pacearchaeota archaeon]